MADIKLFLDTNVVIDYLNVRQPYFEKARLLMICGRVGEFNLMISSSQMTDLVYILSKGGQADLMPSVLKRLQGLRTFVEVYPTGASEVDLMLATKWADPEDALLFECALAAGADAVITRNASDFESDVLPVMDADTFFEWLEKTCDLVYDIVEY